MVVMTPTEPLTTVRNSAITVRPSSSGFALNGLPISEQPSIEAINRDEYADLFVSLFERSGVCFSVLDRRLRLLHANEAFVRHFGPQASAPDGLPFCDLLHPGVRQRVAQQFGMLVAGHRVRVHERVVCQSIRATTFAADLTGIATFNEAKRAHAILVLCRPEGQASESKQLIHPGKTISALEARILEGVAAGMSTVQVAGKLHLSRQGVEYHVSAMLRRFRVPNRSALISKAYSIGILGVDCWPPKALPDFVR
jgi:DNA-binding CsgD family transcriptional regulator